MYSIIYLYIYLKCVYVYIHIHIYVFLCISKMNDSNDTRDWREKLGFL